MLENLIVARTLRVPRSSPPGAEPTVDGSAVARQMDAALAHVGFKASGPLLRDLSALEGGPALDRALLVLRSVRELVGDHVTHNVYFKDFPANVPDTMEFWLSSLRRALTPTVGADGGTLTDAELLGAFPGGFDLLALPGYGTYQHSYADMLAAHDEFVPSAKDRVTVIHLGGTMQEEAGLIYHSLAGSVTPLGEGDLELLRLLAEMCLDTEQPQTVPVRESRAVVNAVRLAAGRALIDVDAVTDVLRLAAQVSGGDPGLRGRARFRSFTRAERRVLMAALDAIVADAPAKLGDVNRHARRWQRLGECLHPGEVGFARFPHARAVFEVARGSKKARSLAASVEAAFADGDVSTAVRRLSMAPGMLVRSTDRLLRTASAEEVEEVLAAVDRAADSASTRVLLSLREHLDNRREPDFRRLFANRDRRAWVTEDRRRPLAPPVVEQAVAMLDEAILRRLPAHDTLVVDPDVLPVGLPLSGRASEDGLAVMPRGSTFKVQGDVLRFFVHWREKAERTDFDLSAVFLDAGFENIGQVSYTSYHFGSAVHSGDITEASHGATEMVDVTLSDTAATYIVPQVNVYAGEGFDEVGESLFGFMSRAADQLGAPFEPRTVRMRSEMRGTGKVALPLVFMRRDDAWYGKWMHLYLSGMPRFNQVEANRLTTAMLARSIAERHYLPVGYLVRLLMRKAGKVVLVGEREVFDAPVTFVGLSAPETGLPPGSTVVTLAELNRLIPE